MKNPRSFFLAGLLLLLSGKTPIHAAPITWANSGTAWATGANWVGGVAPVPDTVTDTAVFDSATFTSQPNYGNTSINGIQVGDGVTATGALTFSGTSLAIGSGGITVTVNAGAVTFNSTTGAALKLDGSQSWVNNSGSLLTVASTVSNLGAATPATLIISGSGTGGTTITGIISDGTSGGTTAVNINTTAGVTTLSGANTFTGGMTLTQGVLRVAAPAASNTSLGAGPITLAGGELQLARNTATSFSSAAPVTVTGDTQVTSDVATSGNAGVSHTMGTLSMGSETLTVASGSNVGSGTATIIFGATTLTGSSTFAVMNGGLSITQLTLGALNGTGSLTKAGSGNLSLGTAAGTFSGDTYLKSGTISAGSATSLGTGTLHIGDTSGNNSAAFNPTTSSSGKTFANNIVVEAGSTGTKSIITTVAGSNASITLSGTVTLNDNLTIATNPSPTGGITLGGPIIVASGSNISIISIAASNVTLSGQLGIGLDHLIQNGTGTFSVGANNSAFTGDETILQGGFTASGQDSLNASNVVFVNAGTTFSKGSAGSSSAGLSTIAGLNDGPAGGGTVVRAGGGGTRPLELGGSGTYSFSGSITDTAANPMPLVKTGIGTQILSGISNYVSSTNIVNGTIRLMGNTGALTGTSAFNMNGGTFIEDNTGSSGSKTQANGALTFTGGASVIEAIQGDASTSTLSFASLGTRTAGATGNFIVADGTNGTTNSIVLTAQAAGYMGQGYFFNGSNYAYYDAAGYVRAINWGTDAGSSTAAGGTTLASGSYVQTTADVTAQATATFTVLNIVNTANAAQAFTLAGNATVTTSGILRSGNGGTASLTTISSGSLKAASNAELVIRTDAVNDLLAINSNIIANGSNGLTKDGAGTLTLGGSNTYTGQTNIDDGTLSISANSNLGNQATGASLILNNGALQATSTFGLYNGAAGTNNRNIAIINTGTFDVTASNNLTVSGNIGDQWAAHNNASFKRGSLVKTGAGTLTLTGTSTYVGTTTIAGGTLSLGSSGIINGPTIIVGDTAAHSGAIFDVSGLSGGFILASGQTLAGHGTIHGNVATSAGSILSPGNSIGSPTFDAALSIGAGTLLNYDLGTPGTSLTSTGNSDVINVIGTLTLPSGAGTITLNLGDNAGAGGLGSAGTGTYTLFVYGSLAGGTGGSDLTSLFNIGTTPLTGMTYTITNDATHNDIVLTITGTSSGGGGTISTTYSLTSSATTTKIFTSGSTSISSVITNTGTGTADTLDYTGLGGSATGGSVSGSTTSGTGLANGGGSGTNSGQTYVAGTTSGTFVVNPVGTGSNTTAGGSATLSGSTPVSVSVYDQASLTTSTTTGNQATPANLILTNGTSTGGASGQRAGVTVTGLSASNVQATDNTNNFATPVTTGSAVADAHGTTTSATVGTASVLGKRLNGTYTETVTGTTRYTDNTLNGQQSVGNQTWNITATVSGNASTSRSDVYTANVLSGKAYGTSNSSGFSLGSNLVSSGHQATTATLLNSSLTASATTDVNMSFDKTAANAVANSFRSSDILTLSGLNSTSPISGVQLTDVYVLQLSYDTTATGAQYLGWNNGTQFVNAISGDSTGNTTPYLDGNEVVGAYSGQTTVGTYGYDPTNHVVWAVLNHGGITNGSGTLIAGTNEFAAIPEPSTWGMILGGFGMLGFQKLRRRRAGT